MSKLKPIRDPFDYILPRNKQDYADSTVIGLVGPKRSCKSLLLAKLLYRDMCLGRKVWSTMDVHTPKFFLDKGFPDIHTKMIDWDAFFMMSEEYQDGTIGIDEASAFNSNRSPLTARNRVTNAFTNQVGHRSIDIIWTAKSAGWLDRQGLGFETDIEIDCQDMAKTTWGRLHHIKKGTFVYLEAWDRSGALTGKAADRRDKFARPFKCWYWGKGGPEIYHTAYNTRALLSVEDIFGGVKFDFMKRVISNKKAIYNEIRRSLHSLAREFQSRGSDEVPCDTFWATANHVYGIEGDSRSLGKYLHPLGIKRKAKRSGNVYLLDNLISEPEME
ncbi:MAG: hypothetical protein WC312_05210 [Candidatus Omnitrophota bacterium]|jgi:hypothetical protein